MINIFLSASIPLPNRDPVFLETADVVCIREAIKALVVAVIPHGNIVFGGHPAITPLVAHLLRQMPREFEGRFILYQSEYFRSKFVVDVDEFIDLRITESILDSRDLSLRELRAHMIGDTAFDAGVFIGGMEGVFDEFAIFRESHPQAKLFPIASTGAAALNLFHDFCSMDRRLIDSLTYSSLFREIVSELSPDPDPDPDPDPAPDPDPSLGGGLW